MIGRVALSARIWSRLDDDLRKTVGKSACPDAGYAADVSMGDLADRLKRRELNRMLAERDLYDEEAGKKTPPATRGRAIC